MYTVYRALNARIVNLLVLQQLNIYFKKYEMFRCQWLMTSVVWLWLSSSSSRFIGQPFSWRCCKKTWLLPVSFITTRQRDSWLVPVSFITTRQKDSWLVVSPSFTARQKDSWRFASLFITNPLAHLVFRVLWLVSTYGLICPCSPFRNRVLYHYSFQTL